MSKTKKYIIWIIVIAAIIGSVFYFRSSKPKTQYTFESIRRINVTQTVSVTGELAADNQVDLAFKSSGKISGINVAVGDKVAAGQKMASLEAIDLEISFQQSNQDLQYQRNTLYNMKRRKDTYNHQQEDAQRALVKKAVLEIEDLQNQIRERTISAPFAGTVIKKNNEIGEMAVANAAILTLAGEGELILESNIPESDIIKISVGQKATVEMDAFPSAEKFEAEVYEIEPAATVIQDVIYYKTKLRFLKSDTRFKNGMSADIDVKTAEKPNVLAVPARAVKIEGEKKYVEIMKNETTQETEKRYIKTGLEGDEGLVEVVSGLNEGESVITLIKTQ